jgi:hypothetical protein
MLGAILWQIIDVEVTGKPHERGSLSRLIVELAIATQIPMQYWIDRGHTYSVRDTKGKGDKMAEVKVEYNEKDLRQIKRAFKAMSDEAIDQSNKLGVKLAGLMVNKIKSAASTSQQRKIAATGRVSKASRIGEFSFGYAKKDFSGGADTRKNTAKQPLYGNGILAGVEFGSVNYPQFQYRRKEGYFIYPTLKANQTEIIDQWEAAFTKIRKEWNK